jgi:hypothetical protein
MSITGSQDDIIVTPAPASAVLVAGFPSPTHRHAVHTFTVTALDAYGNIAADYTGTVHFSSTDGSAALPAEYTFTADDAGVHTFAAAFNRLGTFSLSATDTADPSLTGNQADIHVVRRGGGGPAPRAGAGSGNSSPAPAASSPDSHAPSPTADRQAVRLADYLFAAAAGGGDDVFAMLDARHRAWLDALDAMMAIFGG